MNRTTNSRRRLRGEVQIAVAGAVVYVAVAALLDTGNILRWILALVLFAITFVAIPFLVRARRLDWFHPLGFPVVYVALVMIVPLLYVFISQRPVWILSPDDITIQLVVGLLLALAALFIGTLLGLRSEDHADDQSSGRIRWLRVHNAGLAILGVLLLVEFGLLTTSGASFYQGANLEDYGITSLLSTTINALALPATVLLVVGSIRLRGRLLYGPGLTVVIVLDLLLLVSGTRNEVIAQVLFLLWAYHTLLRRLPLLRLVAATVALLVLIAVVQATRIGIVAPATFSDFGKAIVADLTGPLAITSDVIDRVPSEIDHEWGSTYLAAVEYLPPGPISRTLFGPAETGTYKYRELIGLDDPNFGVGFSLLAEAYFNFSWFGLLVVPLLTGLLFGWSYRYATSYPTRALNLLYPVLLALLPMAFRSDALYQVKAVGYAMGLIALVFWLSRVDESRRVPAVPVLGAIEPVE